MSFISRELGKPGRALREASGEEYERIYAAQQALSWALDPEAYKSPVVMLTGIQEEKADYPECPRPLPFSDICSRND